MAYEWVNTLIDGLGTAGRFTNAISPFLNIGGSIYDRNQTRDAISSGFDQYKGYADRSLNVLGDVYNQGRNTLKPYLQAGNRGLSGYQNLLQNPNQITNDPGYQFRLGQGAEGMRRQLATAGFRGSGNSAIELTKYGQDYATSEYDKALARYLPMVQTGQNATGQLTDLGRNYSYGVSHINEALGGAAAGAEVGSAGANSRMVTDFLGMTGGNPFSSAADALNSGRNVVSGVNNLATAGNGNPLAAVGQIGRETFNNTTPGSFGDINPLHGSRNTARMPSGTNALANGLTSSAAGAGISNTLASWTANGAPVAGSLPYSPVGNFSPAANAGANALSKTGLNAAGQVPANSVLNSATKFLTTAPGMGIVAGVLTGIMTGDWVKGATVGAGTAGGAALGSMVMPGIGTAIGAALGGFLGGKIGPDPSDESSQTTVRFSKNNAIENYGSEASGANKTLSDTTVKSVKGWADLVADVIPGARFTGSFDIIAGSRDGMRVRYFKDGKRVMFNAGSDPKKFAQYIADGFTSSIRGVPPNVVDAIGKVNFSNKALAKRQLQHIKDTMMPAARTR